MKKTLLALVLTIAAVIALPAFAIAGVWHGQNLAGKPFTIQGIGKPMWTSPWGLNVPCESMTGAGSYSSETTATLTLAFHGCFAGVGPHCGTTGQPTGTVTTTELILHNITSGHKPAILITPNAATGYFTHSTCWLLETLKGNGIIGTITAPVCGGSRDSATLVFNPSSWGVQADRTITTSGTEYTMERNNGEKLALEAHATMSFPEAMYMACT